MANGNGRPHSAAGAILTSSFVKLNAAVDFTVAQAGAGDKPYGVAQDGTFAAPNLIEALGGTITANLAATAAGQQLAVFTEGDVCKLRVGSGGCSNGDLLKPAASGKAVVAGTGDWYGFRSFGTAADGEYVDGEVVYGQIN